MAKDGGVLYGMANNQITAPEELGVVQVIGEEGQIEPPLGFVNTLVEENWAESNLIHILLSEMLIRDCEMVNNYA